MKGHYISIAASSLPDWVSVEVRRFFEDFDEFSFAFNEVLTNDEGWWLLDKEGVHFEGFMSLVGRSYHILKRDKKLGSLNILSIGDGIHVEVSLSAERDIKFSEILSLLEKVVALCSEDSNSKKSDALAKILIDLVGSLWDRATDAKGSEMTDFSTKFSGNGGLNKYLKKTVAFKRAREE